MKEDTEIAIKYLLLKSLLVIYIYILVILGNSVVFI